MEENKVQPTLEELSQQIDDLKKQIKVAERESLQSKKQETDNTEYVKRKTKKYPSRTEMKDLGIKAKVVPVEPKALKYLSHESKNVFKCTTRPHVLPAIVKTVIYSVLIVLGILFCVNGMQSATGQEAVIGNVAGIFIIAIVGSFLALKPAQLLEGYNDVSTSADNVIDWIALILNIVGMVLAFPARIFSAFIKGSKRMQQANMVRVAVPLGFGLDEIIEYGEEMDEWASLSSTLDRVQNYDKKQEALKQIDNIIDQAESMKVGETVENQEALDEVIELANEKKSEIED